MTCTLRGVALCAVLFACSDSNAPAGGDGGAPPGTQTSNGLTVSASATTVEAGNELGFKAVATSSGSEIAPTWSVVSGGANIDAKGTLLPFEAGSVEVKAALGDLSGTLTVAVTAAQGAWPGNVGYGGSDNEAGSDVVVDASNNVYLAGSAATSAGSSAYVTRFLPNGKRAWTTVVSANQNDTTSGLLLHADGGVVVTDLYRTGTRIVHLDARGQTVWATQLDGILISGIARGASGDVYASGQVTRQTDPSPQGADGALLRFDAAGKEKWRKTFGKAYLTAGTALAVDEDRRQIAVTGLVQFASISNAAAMIRGFDTDGNEQWNHFFDAAGLTDDPKTSTLAQTADIGLDVALGDGGAIYVGGAFFTTEAGTNVPFLARLGATGALEWLKDEHTTPEMIEQVGGGISSLVFRHETNDLVIVTTAGGYHTGFADYVSAVMSIDTTGKIGWRRVPKAAANALTPNPGVSIRGLTRSGTGELYFAGDTFGDWGRPNPATAENLQGRDAVIGRLDANGD